VGFVGQKAEQIYCSNDQNNLEIFVLKGIHQHSGQSDWH
jgi:hypothetical protein